MNNKFSENLKKIRKDHNLSQEQLADELGVSQQVISKNLVSAKKKLKKYLKKWL